MRSKANLKPVPAINSGQTLREAEGSKPKPGDRQRKIQTCAEPCRSIKIPNRIR